MVTGLGEYIERRGLSVAAAGRELDKPTETVRRWCLPSAHPDARIPRPAEMRRIYVWSHGAVDPNSFYDLPVLPASAGAEAREGVSSRHRLAPAGADPDPDPNPDLGQARPASFVECHRAGDAT